MQVLESIIGKIAAALGLKLRIGRSEEMLPLGTFILIAIVKIVAITLDHGKRLLELSTILYKRCYRCKERLPIRTSKVPRKINSQRVGIRNQNREVNIYSIIQAMPVNHFGRKHSLNRRW